MQEQAQREGEKCLPLEVVVLFGLDALGCIKLRSSVNFKRGAGWFARAEHRSFLMENNQ